MPMPIVFPTSTARPNASPSAWCSRPVEGVESGAGCVVTSAVRLPALRAELGRSVRLGSAARTLLLRAHRRSALRTELAALGLGSALRTAHRRSLRQIPRSEIVDLARLLHGL